MRSRIGTNERTNPIFPHFSSLPSFPGREAGLPCEIIRLSRINLLTLYYYSGISAQEILLDFSQALSVTPLGNTNTRQNLEVLEIRNPLLLLLLSRLFLLRLATRQLLSLLFQLPPRRTDLLGKIPIQTKPVSFHFIAKKYLITHNLYDSFSVSTQKKTEISIKGKNLLVNGHIINCSFL